jgi:hypothetical protein
MSVTDMEIDWALLGFRCQKNLLVRLLANLWDATSYLSKPKYRGTAGSGVLLLSSI